MCSLDLNIYESDVTGVLFQILTISIYFAVTNSIQKRKRDDDNMPTQNQNRPFAIGGEEGVNQQNEVGEKSYGLRASTTDRGGNCKCISSTYLSIQFTLFC